MEKKDRIIEVSFIVMIILFPFREINGFSVRLDLLGIFFFCASTLFFDIKRILSLLDLKFYKFFAAFVGYSFLVNLFYSLSNSYPLYLSNSVLYLGILVFCLCFHSLLQKNDKQTLHNLISFSLVPLVVMVCYVLFFEETTRAKTFFNNPNQLGIYALYLSTLASISFLPRLKVISRNIFLIIALLSVFIVLSSLSRAAILAVGLLSIINLLFFRKTAILYSLAGILMYFLSSYGFTQEETRKGPGMQYRFLEERTHDDNPLNRGYTRLWDYPKYLVFGAGEQQQFRFNDRFEFHSSYGNILFSYGFLGFSLFFFFYKEAFYPFTWVHLLLIPILFNSLLHNDIRNIFLWMITITLFFYKNTEKIKT